MNDQADDRFSSISDRRATRRRLLAYAAAGAGAAAVGLPAVERAAAAGAQEARPLIFGRNIDDVITFDPAVAGEETFTVVFRACYDTLLSVQPDDASVLVPMLAESWEVSEDVTTFTFLLKEGLTFSSGNPVTSADVKFSYDRLKNLKALPSYAAEPIASVETPDERTVVITLTSPNSTFLLALTSSFNVVDSEVVKANGGTSEPGADQTDKASAWLTQNSAGTGPYVLTGYTPKDRITLRRNPTSWRSANIDDVLFQAAPDTSALGQMLERGDVDLAWGLLTEQLEAFADNPDVAIASVPMQGFIALGMTCDPAMNEAIANPEVRQALKYAIDYDGIRSLREGAETPPSIVPIGIPGALDPATDGIKRDVARATEMLAAAGYSDGLTAVLSTSSTEILGGVALSLLAEKVQADLSEVGVTVELDVQDETIFRPKYRAGDLELVIGAFYAGFPHAVEFFDYWGATGATPVNRFRWQAADHPSVAMIDEMRQTIDQARQVELIEEAQRALLVDAPYTMLIQPVFSYPHRTTITGVVPNASWNFDPSTIERT